MDDFDAMIVLRWMILMDDGIAMADCIAILRWLIEKCIAMADCIVVLHLLIVYCIAMADCYG